MESFDGLYSLIKSDDDLYNEFLERANLFGEKRFWGKRLRNKLKQNSTSIDYKFYFHIFAEKYEEILGWINTKDFDPIINGPFELCLQVNRVCFNGCKDCAAKPNGEILDYKGVKEIEKYKPVIQFTGGETLLSDDLEDLILSFDKAHPYQSVSVDLITSGINPDTKSDFQEQYYSNLELLFKINKEGIPCALRGDDGKPIILPRLDHGNTSICITFSYSEGIKPKQRLENFLNKFKELKSNYGSAPSIDFRIVKEMGLGIWHNNDLYLEKSNLYETEIKTIYKEVMGEYYEGEIEFSSFIDDSNRNHSFCSLDNVIHIKSDGTVHPCATVQQSFKPLTPIATINDSHDVIIDKRRVYLGIMQKFEEDNYSQENQFGLHCKMCTNGFNNYLTELESQLGNYLVAEITPVFIN